MLNIVCVKHGDLYSSDYVNILFDMVRRNLFEGKQGKFICFTDDPEYLDEGIEVRSLPGNLTGWWNKLYLFKKDLFPEGDRIVYFDLDTVIVGGLDHIVNYDGDFAILRDFYRPLGLQSSVMAWKANHCSEWWDEYERLGYPEIVGGDQSFIEGCVEDPDLWQELFPGNFVSYKVHAKNKIPDNSKVIVFHGNPRPHEVLDGWVPKVWCKGGGSIFDLELVCNIAEDKLIENIEYAISLDIPWITQEEPHDDVAIILGGGPSINDEFSSLSAHIKGGAKVFTVNGTHAWARHHDISPNFHVFLDARPENIQFLPDEPVKLYLSSQCSKEIFDQAKGDVHLYHPMIEGIADIIGEDTRPQCFIGGTTVGLKALCLAYTLGYRKMHLFGMDSCYVDGKHHAYSQALNDNEKVIDFEVGGRKFKAAAWMAGQANEFRILAAELVSLGCEISIHGDGLLQQMAVILGQPSAADERAKSILEELENIENPTGVEVGVFAGDLSLRLLQRSDLTLYMVDSWEEHDKDGSYAKSGDFHGALDREQQDQYYEKTIHVTNFAKDRAIIVRKDSLTAAKDFEDNSLDFVFLDADHTYEAVKADIDAWHPKIKEGGILCGHDYAHPDYLDWGVDKAVDELVALQNSQLRLGLNYTWFTNKGK